MKTKTIVLITLLIQIWTASFVAAESANKCDQYAKSAVSQFQQAKALGMQTPYPAWQDNYQVHYNWCLGQSLKTIETEHAKRQTAIEEFKRTHKTAIPMKTGILTPALINPKMVKAVPLATLKASVGVTGIQAKSGQTYRVINQVNVKNKVFIDRNFQFRRLPPFLKNGVHIQTANNDKFSPASTTFLSFSIDQPGIVFIGHDKRYKKIPSWLHSFQKTNETLVYSVDGSSITCDLYKKQIPKGRVILGGNQPQDVRDNLSMYTVFVTPAPVAPSLSKDTQKTAHKQKIVQQVEAYKTMFDSMASIDLHSYNQRIDLAIQAGVLRQKKMNANAFNALPTPTQIKNQLLAQIPNNGQAHKIDLSEYEAMPRKMGEKIRLKKKKKHAAHTVATMKVDSSLMMNPVRPVDVGKLSVDGLQQIVSFPGSNDLEPGDYVYISGMGFGNMPGTVKLEYLVNRQEFSHEWVKHTITVLPGTHELTWRDNIIVFRLPGQMPDVNKIHKGKGLGKAVLSLNLKSGQTINRNVKIRPNVVDIADIWTDSSIDVDSYTPDRPDHWEKARDAASRTDFYHKVPDKFAGAYQVHKEYRSIEPGSEVYIIGNGFQNIPGKIKLSINGRNVPIYPVGEEWWTNYGIRFKVGDLPGHYKRSVAMFSIELANTQQIYNYTGHLFVYGPEMTVKVVSGSKWFEPEWDEDESYAKSDEKDLVQFVSHYPGCGFFSTSESGVDHFFRKLKLPEGVVLKSFTFTEIEHEDAQDQMKYLKNYLKDLLFSMDGFGFLDVALGVIFKNFKLLFQSAIDSLFGDGGGYFARIYHLPQKQADAPHIPVNWENSCTGTTGGLPIMYMTTFVITGPKTILDAM